MLEGFKGEALVVKVEMLEWLWLLFNWRFLTLEFRFELGLISKFDDCKIPDLETVSLA